MLINAGKNGRVPDFVFLAHVVDVTSSMHVPFVLRSLASLPFKTRLIYVPFWPTALASLLAMWAWSKTFLVAFYNLRGRLHQTWAVPRFGFQVSSFCPLSSISSIQLRLLNSLLLIKVAIFFLFR